MILEKQALPSSAALLAMASGAEETALIRRYAALLPAYRGAMKYICAKFETLSDEFCLHYRRDPIHHIERRIKQPQSIMRKLHRKNMPLTPDSLVSGVRDIAGVRIVCQYIDDVYRLAEMLVRQDDVTLLRRRDYIASPKESGYRGLHLLITVPVHLPGGKQVVPAEVQLRTIAMDSWAALEHELQYKNATALPSRLTDQLRMCAETAAVLDRNMQSIMQQIERSADEDGGAKA